jgi:hypothetical protein
MVAEASRLGIDTDTLVSLVRETNNGQANNGQANHDQANHGQGGSNL